MTTKRTIARVPRRLGRFVFGCSALALGLVSAAAALTTFAPPSIGAEPGLTRRPVVHNNGGFRLLRFTGAPMKWGAGRLGRPAVVTWRVAKRTRHFEGARNCGAVTPIENALAPSGIARDAFMEEMRAAMRMWEDAAGITFRKARRGEKADLVVGAQLRPRGRAFTNVSAMRMVKVGARRRIDRLDQAIVCLNPQRPWKVGFDGNLKVYDLRHTLLHEFGHVIGLDHIGPSGAVMGFRYDERHSGLTRGDVIGAQRLYGLPTFLAPRVPENRALDPVLNLVSGR